MLYNFCDNSAVRPTKCGPPKVYQVEKGSNATSIDLTAMDYTDSCTFKIFAKCSSPIFTVNATDVNVLVASFKGKDTDSGSDDAANNTMSLAPKKNGKTIATVSDKV
jgi:hypothetical protein